MIKPLDEIHKKQCISDQFASAREKHTPVVFVCNFLQMEEKSKEVGGM